MIPKRSCKAIVLRKAHAVMVAPREPSPGAATGRGGRALIAPRSVFVFTPSPQSLRNPYLNVTRSPPSDLPLRAAAHRRGTMSIMLPWNVRRDYDASLGGHTCEYGRPCRFARKRVVGTTSNDRWTSLEAARREVAGFLRGSRALPVNVVGTLLKTFSRNARRRKPLSPPRTWDTFAFWSARVPVPVRRTTKVAYVRSLHRARVTRTHGTLPFRSVGRPAGFFFVAPKLAEI